MTDGWGRWLLSSEEPRPTGEVLEQLRREYAEATDPLERERIRQLGRAVRALNDLEM